MKKILIPVTNHSKLGETNQANGTYAPELTHVINVFMENDVDYDIASIKGGAAPLYGTDMEDDEINLRVLQSEFFQQRINNTLSVSEVIIEDYDAIFYPGGFGLLSDLASNDDFAKLAATHYESGGIIGAVCHGPAALLLITLSSGEKLLAHRSVTGFTREEEIDFGTIDDIPFLLEESLTRTAGRYSKVQPWKEFVIEDDRIITGQNPASANGVGAAIIKHLN